MELMLALQEYIIQHFFKHASLSSSDDFQMEFVCRSAAGVFFVVRRGNDVRAIRTDCHDQMEFTEWPFASISKPVVSMIASRLHQERVLDLDQPLVAALNISKDRIICESLQKVTIRHLLSHCSGLPKEVNDDVWAKLNFPNKDELVQRFCKTVPKHEPGKKILYSNFAFALGAFAIEFLTQKKISAHWLALSCSDENLKKITFRENLQFSSIVHNVLRERQLQLQAYGPAGGVVASSFSLAYFMEHVMTEEARKLPVESESNHTRLAIDRENALIDEEIGDKVGLLWHYKTLQHIDSAAIYHTGTLPGISSFLIGFPELRLSACCVSNQNIDTKPFIDVLVRDLALLEEWTRSARAEFSAVYKMPYFDSQISVWLTFDKTEIFAIQHLNQCIKIYLRVPASDDVVLHSSSGEKIILRFEEAGKRVWFNEQCYFKHENWPGF